MSTSPVNDHGAIPIVSRDLLYCGLFEHSLMEVHIWKVVRDDAGRIRTWQLVDANPPALRSWGRSLAEIVGKTTEQIFVDADPIGTFLPIIEEIMATGTPKQWELPFSSTAQILRMISVPVGEYFISTGLDVTAERRQEARLQDALRSLTQATQAGGVGLWDWDLVTDQVHYSDEYKRQLGYAPHEFADDFEEWRARCHPDDLAATMAQVQATSAGPTRDHVVVFRMRHRDGDYRWIMARAAVVLGDDGRPRRMLGSHIDITERRRIEEKLAEAQRLDSLGTLAAGIAHDFNNLLTAMSGNLSLLRAAYLMDPKAETLIKELEEVSGRATSLTRQLLTFSKGGAPVKGVTQVRELLVQDATFVSRGSNVRCEFRLADDLDAVEADAGQLGQVFDNLVINAIQAMPRGGIVRIDAVNLTLAEGNEWGLPAGRFVRIDVVDQGPGIPPDVLPRIFDPFFTTKSSGSGLGLAIAYSVVSRHGGRITVRSNEATGSVFSILLPSARAPHRAVQNASPPVTGGGRVLVMDDDPAIRRLYLRMLERLGYTCDVSADGDEAIRMFDAAIDASQAYDAVILDLTIPGGRGGTEVLKALQQIDPQVVAIVASGYAEHGALAQPGHNGFRGRLVKPFDLDALGRELARVLRRDEHASPSP